MLPIQTGAGAPDCLSCRYGHSRLAFRGPPRDLSQPYVAILGGSATFGKHVASPFPALVEGLVGVPVVNLGALNAGPDFYLSDPAALDVAARARVAVVQVPGAEALTNPFFTVHSRRNDRFLTARPSLRALFPEVEVTDIHFTRHLLLALSRTDVVRFSSVVQALKANWVARMQALLACLPPRRILLWLADVPPPDQAAEIGPDPGPLLVDAQMLAALRPAVSAVVQAIPSSAARAKDAAHPQDLVTDSRLARCLPGPAAHAEVARLLSPCVAALMHRRLDPLLLQPTMAVGQVA